MQLFNALFEDKIDKYLSIQSVLNPKYSPDSLLKILKSKSQCKSLKKKLSTKTKNIFKIFKRLSICSLLVIYSNKFYDLIGQLPVIKIQNQWIDQQFVQNYYMFLKKICYSSQLYENVKKQCSMNSPSKNMQMLFYDIGLLKMLFKIVNKMALLGRYYKSKNQQIVSNFITTLSLHAQKIYVSFRHILGQIIQYPKVYIPTKNQQNMLKVVLKDELPWINQQMKKLFLDKYFYPLGKGIGIKLFKPQQQPAQSEKLIRGIVSNHQQTDRANRKNQLQITLFPGPGRVNIKFYEQTLLSHMAIDIESVGDNNFEEQLGNIDLVEDGESLNVSVDSQCFGNQSSNIHKDMMTSKVNENDIETGIQRYEENHMEL